MFGILTAVSRPKPEIRLAQAVSAFEADLSNEQKTSFQNYRSQSLNSPPDLSDVMRLTAEIDRQASRKAGRRFGPRFTNFLQIVQQFAALGDVVVGCSQNMIACGVWSLVRMSLLSIVNYSSYLEKVSALFMNVGRSAPRYQTIALLYSRSKSLQLHISEYFIVVVGLCHQLLKFTQKSAFRQVVSTLSDSDIKTFQLDLDICANLIKEEMSLLMAQKIEEEARENSRFRALLSTHSEAALHQQKLATNLQILKFCSNYDHEITWKQTRKVGNATLFSQAAEYQEWKSQVKSCTLLYTGKLGSGKSVLLANIVDDLHIYIQSTNVAVAYFFCRHDIPESLKAKTVIGSLAQQLLRTIPDLTTVAKLCNWTSSAPDFDEILKLLCRALPPNYKAYFVLDGLDECNQLERDTLVQQLKKLQETLALLLCASFRVEPNNALELDPARFISARMTSIPDDNPDIKTFIEAELECCLEHRKLVIGDPTLILEIQDALLEGSKGMFLWVALQIHSLCAMKTDQDIRDALVDLPKDLSDTFSRILRRLKGTGKSYQRQILQLVLVAYQPLTGDELREALSVVPGDTNWNPSSLLNDIYSTLACCGCLLIVDEEELTVRFVHHSVKQFLLSSLQDSADIAFTIESAQWIMADIIVTYLSYGVFGTELSTIRVPQIVIGSAPSRIIRSTLESSSSVQSLALRLLKSRKRHDYNISKTLAGVRKDFQSYQVDAFRFYSYAKQYWLQHILYFLEQDLVMFDLLLRLQKGKVLNTIITDEDGWTLLWRAAENGDEAVVKLLLETGKVDVDSKDTQYGRTPLSWAAKNGHKAVVKLLLETGKVDVNSKDTQYGQTPLWWAAENGHEAVVKLLLETGKVDVDSKDTQYWRTPLWWAAKNGHKAVVKLLLETGKVDVNSNDTQYGQTPLLWAARKGNEVVVKLLLETGKVDFDLKEDTEYGQTPLWWAAENGHEAVVKLLQSHSNLYKVQRNQF